MGAKNRNLRAHRGVHSFGVRPAAGDTARRGILRGGRCWMARTNTTNFSGGLQFPYATAGTDPFKKEDVQTLALAVDGHDHSTGKGLPLAAGSIPNGTITRHDCRRDNRYGRPEGGSVTSAKIADGTIATADLANASVTNAKLAADTDRVESAGQRRVGNLAAWSRPYHHQRSVRR